jgi:hypothetical protein
MLDQVPPPPGPRVELGWSGCLTLALLFAVVMWAFAGFPGFSSKRQIRDRDSAADSAVVQPIEKGNQ